MKIMYCVTRSEWGGAQSHIYELISNQSKKKKNQIVLVVGNEGDLTQKINSNNIECNIIILKELKRNISPKSDFIAVRKLKKLIGFEQPDIIHLHSSKAGAIGRIASIQIDLKKRPKTIFTVHGWAFTDGVSKVKSFVYKKIEKILAIKTDKIICVSKFDYQLGIRNKIATSSKMEVIYNGVASNMINLNNKQKSEFIDFIMVARFSSVQKRQDLLIEAIKLLDNKDREKIRVCFIGEGDQVDHCKKLVKNYRLNNVEFLGFKNNPQVFFTNRTYLTLISDYEGLPISIIEGMASECPIVASDVGGVNELVDNYINGYLVNNNPEDIKDTILNIIHQKDTVYDKMAYVSGKKFRENFSIEKFADATDEIYNELKKEFLNE